MFVLKLIAFKKIKFSLKYPLKEKKLLKAVRRELYRRNIKVLQRKPILWIIQKVFGLEIVTIDKLVNNNDKYRLHTFGSKESVSISEPITSAEVPHVLRKYRGNFTFERPFVCEVANAELVGPKAIGFDETGGLILETTIPQYYLSKYRLERSITLRTLARKKLPELRVAKLDIACSLVYKWEGNYWHWMVDCLTRLEGLEYYHKQTGVKPCLIISSNPTSWQLELLRLLGYNSNNCLHWNGTKMQVERLVVPSFRRFIVNKNLHSFVSPQACRWVSQRILSNLPNVEDNNSYSANVFVSRRKALGRRVINEDDVIEALSSLGFAAYVLEDMSVTEQVRLFSQARMVVAPHGAGLTNMIFAQNLAVIELFGSFMQPCYFLLAKGLGFQYGFLKGQSPRTEVRLQDGNMIVNTNKLLKLISTMQGTPNPSFVTLSQEKRINRRSPPS